MKQPHKLLVQRIIIVLVVNYFSWSLQAQYNLVSLSADQSVIAVSDFHYVGDPAGELEIQDVSSPGFQSNFTSYLESSVPFEHDIYWLKFKLENKSNRDNVWIVNIDTWLEVNYYFKNESDSEFQEKITGHLVPFSKRDYPVANKNYIRLEISKNEILTCFVRLETHDNYTIKPTGLNFKIYTETFQLKKDSRVKNLIFMFLGIYIVMLLYNFFIYFSTKDKSYLYYLIILVIMSIIVIHNSGYFHPIFSFFDGYASWYGPSDVILGALMGVSIFYFAISFLELKERLPKWYKVLQILTVIVLLHPIPCFFGYTFLTYNISNLIGLVAMVTVITIGIRSYQIGTPSAGYFILAYGCFIVGIIIQIIVLITGVLDNFWEGDFNSFILSIGSAAEVVLFSFALGNKINVLRKDNNEKQLLIINQLDENQKLQTKVNRELEEKVRERTIEIAEEKEKSDNLLLNILPASTANELKQKGYASTKVYEKVSVLFTDIESFTSLAAEMTPDDLVQNLDYCFKAFDEIVERNGLEKIKTIGDAYMCAGGVPIANDSNPEDAIIAAIEMKNFMNEWNKSMEEEGKKPWNVRFGIHTGDVIAGVVGRKKFAYDIWGDTVNIASRMETNGKIGKINISESTYNYVKDKFEIKHRGKIYTKGKGEINMYFVEGIKQSV